MTYYKLKNQNYPHFIEISDRCNSYNIQYKRIQYCQSKGGKNQGWEFAHRFSEQIAYSLISSRQISDRERFAQVARGCSFPLSDLSDSLTVALLS